VVQHTFTMLFCLMGKISYYNEYVKSGRYAASTVFTHHAKQFNELAGKKLGIIGLGTIGKRVAEIAMAFGAEVYYYSTTQNNLETGYTHLQLNELLSKSDIVSIHCPLNESTFNLIDADRLGLMKKSAILINTGRGGIVNEQALADAIENNTLAGAALDVLTKEPPDESNPLLKIKDTEKILITPHMAWASTESRTRLMKGIIENIRTYITETYPE